MIWDPYINDIGDPIFVAYCLVALVCGAYWGIKALARRLK
tara:strand:+ start:8682 stop:8801 length:120 start_codon:yes stop_codon:yes gene_type:complete